MDMKAISRELHRLAEEAAKIAAEESKRTTGVRRNGWWWNGLEDRDSLDYAIYFGPDKICHITKERNVGCFITSMLQVMNKAGIRPS